MMLKIFLSFAFFVSCLLLQDCSSATSENSQSKVEPKATPQPTAILPEQENKIQLPSTGKVAFKGVSFTYNPQIFEIQSESIIHESPLQNESDKPGGEFPTHIVFTLQIKDKLIEPEAKIKIMPIADYRRMYAISKGYTEAFDKNLDNLRKVLIDKKFRVKNEIPFIDFYDAHQTFEAKVRLFSFQSGKGILFLSQINQETLLVNNKLLTYYFQGITTDGKNYVTAELPVSVSFLPDSSDVFEFEGYKLCCPYTKDSIKEYEKYISKITKRLENLPPNEFEPNLDELEKIISTLKIEN